MVQPHDVPSVETNTQGPRHMAQETTHLHRLVELAKEPSSERRRELMREVTDLFLQDPTSYSSSENKYFGDIIAQVARDVETAMRVELADRLADVPSAPGDLVRELASGEIEVANPLLKRSEALSEEDLLAIVQNKSPEHALAVSRRDSVSENLSDALVDTGNAKVMVSLVENKGARISRSTMEKVVDKSESIPALQSPLVARADLPPDMMNEMFFFVSKALKEQILERNNDLDEAELEKALAATQAQVTQSFEQQVTQASRAAAKVVENLHRLKQLNERKMMEFLSNKEMDKFTFAFAKLGDLDLKTAQRILANPDCEAVAVVAKASGFDRSTFYSIVLKCGSQDAVKPDEVDALLRLYDKVPPETAQRTMRFWRVRQKVMEDDSGQGAAVA